MFRTLRVVSVLRGFARARSVRAESASLPVYSQRPLDRRPTTARSRVGEQRIETTTSIFRGVTDQQEKLPTLEEVTSRALRQEPVHLSLLQDIVREFPPNLDAETTSKNFLMVLELLGSMTKTYNRADYILMLNQVWDWRTSFKINIFHYNAYLKATMRAESEVDMETCFEEIAQLGLTPNGATYLLFLEHLSERGHVDRALEIFATMQTKDKTREAYHALIKGHLKAGDEAAAREILPQMKAQRVVPNSETYTVLARGLAECGGHADVLEAIKKGKLAPSKIMCILQSTSDVKLMEELCERISKSNMSVPGVKKFCVELIHARKLKEARLIVDKLIRKTGGDLSFFSDQMVASEYPAEQVVAFCRSIECEKERSEAIRAAAERAVHDAQPSAALKYLSAFREEGFPMREHFFYPLICGATSESEASTVVQQMLDWNLQDSERAFAYLFVKLIDEWLNKTTAALARLEQWKVPGDVAKRALAHYFVSFRGFQDCIQALDLLDISIWLEFVPMIAEETTPANKASSLLLIEKISNRAESRRNDIMREYRLNLSMVMAGKIARKLEKPTVLTYSQPLNTWLVAKKRENSKMALVALSSACFGEDQDVVRNHLKNLDEDALGPLPLFSLINFYVRVKNLDRTMYYFNRVCEVPGVEMGDWLILSVVALMIENGRYEEAFGMVKKYKFRRNFKSPSSKASKVSAVVDYSLRFAGFDAAMRMVRELVPKCTPIDAHALLPIIDYTLKHQPERLVEVFKDLEKLCSVTVGLLQIYRYFISSGNERDIQIVHEIAARRHERDAADMFLAFAYILEHEIPKARQLLRSVPKNTVRLSHLKGWCDGLLRKGLITELELAFNTFSECGMNYEPMYLVLAEHYAREGNSEKAQELWLASQEYGVHLSNQTRFKLAQAFKAKGKTPPFVVES